MAEKERVVVNIITASDINKVKEEFSDILARPQIVEMIASRYKLDCGWVDGKHCIILKTRPPTNWDSELQIWKYGARSQMMEKQATGKEVCVVCRNGSVKIHRVSQDGPPLQEHIPFIFHGRM